MNSTTLQGKALAYLSRLVCDYLCIQQNLRDRWLILRSADLVYANRLDKHLG